MVELRLPANGWQSKKNLSLRQGRGVEGVKLGKQERRVGRLAAIWPEFAFWPGDKTHRRGAADAE
jgi:hypothetical protein